MAAALWGAQGSHDDTTRVSSSGVSFLRGFCAQSADGSSPAFCVPATHWLAPLMEELTAERMQCQTGTANGETATHAHVRTDC